MANKLTLRIQSTKEVNPVRLAELGGLHLLAQTESLVVEGDGVAYRWSDADGNQYFVLGEVFGIRRADGSLADAALVVIDPSPFEAPDRFWEIEGRFVVVRIETAGKTEVWADRFGRVDVYWQVIDGGVVLATEIDLLPVAKSGATPSQIGLAHALTVYGARPAKQHTLYEGVKRLGVDQGLCLDNGKVYVLSRKFIPVSTGKYGERQNHEYADILLEAIRARASKDGNVVYLSSGWDSTTILACLVHLFGNRKLRAVIGRMRYADRSGVINQFEIDRASAVADYFGIPLDICELDYRTNAAEILERTRPLLRSQQFANITGINHWLLAETTAKTARGDETIFAGEMSDGAHNLGFSQFVTIFHPASQDFREYSDKMASYLFGPTFLQEILEGRQEHDPIWNLFKSRATTTKFDEISANPNDRTRQFLASFFLRGGRMPFTSLTNSKLLSNNGRVVYAAQMEETYLTRAGSEATPETLYAWFLHLYNSFHWQGATVATLEHTAAAHGMRCALPFHDGRLIEFLSAMPESWGRGLDLKPTKYPLKWMLQNRIDYPLHLQVGPHSYLYDIDPSFSHLGELLFGSSFAAVFKESLASDWCHKRLDPKMFDLDYVDSIVNRYLNNEEVRGAEMNDLGVLAFQSAIGDYAH
jgi:hypothetical protein